MKLQQIFSSDRPMNGKFLQINYEYKNTLKHNKNSKLYRFSSELNICLISIFSTAMNFINQNNMRSQEKRQRKKSVV